MPRLVKKRVLRCVVTGATIGVARFRLTLRCCDQLDGMNAVRDVEAVFGKRGLARALRMLDRAMKAPKKRRKNRE